jgi:prepilin-type N-terminal cleavage/methylation domain-containing protein
MKISIEKDLREKGFTLIELMVSIALFSVVIAIVAAAFTNLLNYNRIALSTNNVSNNLNFVVDAMARSIRTGTNYQCGGIGNGPNCVYSSGRSSLAFTDDSGNIDTYILDTTNHEIGECPNQTTTCIVGSGSYQVLTDPNIKINSLTFYVQGVGNTDGIQPQVIMVIQGQMTVGSKNPPVTFDIETSATQRQIDI